MNALSVGDETSEEETSEGDVQGREGGFVVSPSRGESEYRVKEGMVSKRSVGAMNNRWMAGATWGKKSKDFHDDLLVQHAGLMSSWTLNLRASTNITSLLNAMKQSNME